MTRCPVCGYVEPDPAGIAEAAKAQLEADPDVRAEASRGHEQPVVQPLDEEPVA
jgi:hypothetical protein